MFAAAAAIALASFLVGQAPPAYASPCPPGQALSGVGPGGNPICSVPPQVANTNGPVCTQAGKEADCVKCINELGTSGQPSFRAQWACGAPGRENYYTDEFPCFVGSQPTLQPNCDGTMLDKGDIRRRDGTVTPATGDATRLG